MTSKRYTFWVVTNSCQFRKQAISMKWRKVIYHLNYLIRGDAASSQTWTKKSQQPSLLPFIFHRTTSLLLHKQSRHRSYPCKMALQQTRKEILQLYKKLLRSSATYPSKNRWGIYQAIREEFRVSTEFLRSKRIPCHGYVPHNFSPQCRKTLT